MEKEFFVKSKQEWIDLLEKFDKDTSKNWSETQFAPFGPKNYIVGGFNPDKK